MKKGIHHFFAFISRMKYINRWGLMRNTIPENIQEHSLEVAIIAHALALIKNSLFGGQLDPEKIAVYAMYHDCNETINGDMPTPVKYFSDEIVSAYKKIEEISKNKLISMLPENLKEAYQSILFYDKQDPEAQKIIKSADRISAYIKCLEEKKAGNREFLKAEQSILASIEAGGLPEVQYFMKHFIHSYNLTLDELE